MNRIELYLTPRAAERAPFDHRQIVVVDVLRTCTSLSHALRHGAAKVIPVGGVEEAMRLAQTLDPDQRLLCGERDGVKVNGFDLGNSPREYTADRVAGKTLVFASTNASPLMAGLLVGRDLRLLSYANLSVAVEAVCADGSDLTVVCAGRNGRVALEDTACAGALIRRVAERRAGGVAPELNDAAELAASYDRHHGGEIEAILRRSDHGRDLIGLGFEEDLPVCAAVDSVPVVPFLRDGRIVRGSEPRPSSA